MSLADPNNNPPGSHNALITTKGNAKGKGKPKQKDLTHGLSVANGLTTEHSKTVLRILSSLGEGAVGVPALKSVAQLGLEVVAVIENVKANKDTCHRLAYKVARIVESAQSAVADVASGTPPRHEALTKRINEVASQLATVLAIVEKIQKRNTMQRFLFNAEDVTSLAECDRIADDCLRLLSIEFQATDHATLDRIENLLSEMRQSAQRAAVPQPSVVVQYPIPSVSVSMPEPFSPSPFIPQDNTQPQAFYLQVPDAEEGQPTQGRRRSASSPPLARKENVPDDVAPVKAKTPKEKSKASSGTPRRTSSGNRKTMPDAKSTRRSSVVPDTESEDDQRHKRSSSAASKPSKSSSKSKPSSRTPSPRPPSRTGKTGPSDPRPRSAPPPHGACNGCPTCAQPYPPYPPHPSFYPPPRMQHPGYQPQSFYTPFPPYQFQHPSPYPRPEPSAFPGAANGANLASSIQGFVQASISSALGATAHRLSSSGHGFHPAASSSSRKKSNTKTRKRGSTSKSRRPSTDDEDDIFDIFTTDDDSASDSDD